MRVNTVSRSIVAAVFLWIGIGAQGQITCDIAEELPLTPPPAVPPPTPFPLSEVKLESGEYSWSSGFTSVGWKHLWQNYCPFTEFTGYKVGLHKLDEIPDGFRLGINLMASPSPGNYLPPSPTIGGSSLALLPPGAGSAPTAWRDIGRPTLHGQVDLVTGLPLVQMTDLELPFGSATFRLNRTRSDRREENRLSRGACSGFAMDEWWDWAGAGWMIGENPILLIDSALADVTGDNPRTCWLILDAHHSIPFQQIESNGTYEAPPRFRARMTHNGDWDASSRTWHDDTTGHPPTQYEISLYDGAVTYTFVAIREDVPPHLFNANALVTPPTDPSWVTSDYHQRPYTPNQAIRAGRTDPWDAPVVDPTDYVNNPGAGLPYYGLCVKIEDRHGHKVEINYCPVEQFELDNSDTDCIEWGQTTNRKGQINYIQLKSPGELPGEDKVEWTLVYSHRRFLTIGIPDDPPDYGAPLSWIHRDHPLTSPDYENAHKYEMFSHTMLDRIYVFDGTHSFDESDLEQAQLSLPHTDDGYYENGADPIASSILSASANNWRYLVRYHYLEDGQYPDVQASVPLMIRTSVASLPEGSVTPSSHSTVYIYKTGSLYSDTQGWHPDETGMVDLPWLHLVYTPEDIWRLQEEVDGDPEGEFTGITLHELAHWYIPGTVNRIVSEADQLKRHASIELSPTASYTWSNSSEGSPEEPQALLMLQGGDHGQYITRVTSRLVSDKQPAMVAEAAIRDEDGVKRYYRVSRLQHTPENTLKSVSEDPFRLDSRQAFVYYKEPMRSVFAHPYQWQGYTPASEVDGGELGLAGTMNLKDPLWIAVVDEFNSREAMLSRGTHEGVVYDTSKYRGTDFAATKLGQLNRRIVEISPTGYILKERRWEYTADGISVYGGGLGEEFIYKTVNDYFTAGEIPAAIVPTMHGTPTSPKHPDQLDPWNAVRNELLLVERRSVGWSAADLIDRDPSVIPPYTLPEPGPIAQENGLIHFYEYDVLARPTEDPSDPDFETVPANARVQLVAEGVKKGTSAETLLYTRQIFRSVDRPTEVLCEVEFTEPPMDLLPGPPDYTSQSPEAGIRATHFVSEWDTSEIAATTEQPATSHMVVGPPRQVRPNSDWYYPVEWEHYDEDGNSDWSAVGQLFDPSVPAGTGSALHESITLTYYDRDDEGRSLYTVVDAEPGQAVSAPGAGGIMVPSFVPGGWQRISSSPPLNYVTAFRYGKHGLSDIFYPSGMRWARRVIESFDPEDNPPVPFAREFIFNNLEHVAGTSDPAKFVPRSPGEVRDYASVELRGSPRIKRRVEFLYSDGAPLDFLDDIDGDVGSLQHPAWQELWGIKIAPDANGRLQDVELLEPDPTGAMLAVGSKEVNDLGEVHRTREIDGSITRLTKDSVGQVLRTYVGTEDENWPGYGAGIAGFNMILTERFEYGTGINNAWQPTSLRTYSSMPAWHESMGAHTFSGTEDPIGFYDDAPENDVEGTATVTAYDWRMRPVRVDSYERGNPTVAERLSTTLTWLDHADRPRLVVTFGKGDMDGQTRDPTTVTPEEEDAGTAIPEPSEFYALSLRPTSITQMFYGPDGSMTERRTYDMNATGGSPLPYLAEFSYSGKGGQRVYSQQPGRPIQINKLDGVGRVSQSLTVLPGSGSATPASNGYELSRTDYKYDPNGNAVDVKVWTRIDSGNEVLTCEDPSPNAVRTRTVSWYDVEKRLVATAELGTEENTYSPLPLASEWEYDLEDPSPHADFDGGTYSGVDRGELPDDVPLWIYVYDKRGNQTHMVDPDDRVTKFEYSGSGRLVKKIENASASNPNMIRATEYKHQYGRLTEMATLDTNVTGAGQDQRTIVTYGADVVDDGFTVMSRSKALVGSLTMEGGPTDPIFPDSYVLRYTFQGQIAEREDQRGVVFRYDYDDLGRLVSIQVGHRATGGAFAFGYPASMTPTGGDPLDRIERVEYQYDHAGNLELVTNFGSGSTLISQNEYDYDARGSLLAEWQAIGEAVSASTPHIAYTWDYEPTDISTAVPGGTPPQVGHLRLTEMEYPAVPGSSVRRITMDYGLAGAPGDVLSRLEKMTSNLGEPTVAEFAYFGASRRKSLTLGGSSAGGGVRQSFDTDPGILGLEGLDKFGRVADLHFENAASTPKTMFRGEYTYDILGNRRTSRLTQAPVGAVSQENIFSQLNSYDELNRLVKTEYGTLVGLPSAPAISLPAVRTDEWSLDLLGNWVGGAAAGITGPPINPPAEGRLTKGDLDWFAYSPPRGVDLGGVTPDAGPDQFSMLQVVNERNEIVDFQVEELDAGTLSPVPTKYDLAGNLEFDGDYYYQYDAWNRLIQVNEATWDPIGEEIVPGDIVKHYTYDGHGRLIRIQSPYPNPQTTTPDDFRTERLYYDGIRRIQEVVVDPVLGNSNQGSQSQQEQNQVGGGTATPYLAREYVWGPGDNGFDELLVQYDGSGNEWWAIMDAGGDLVALCDFGGANGEARVVGQWTYDPYGAVLSADHLHAMALPHLGHKGLFLDRLDVGIVTGYGGAESPRLVPYAHSLYHNRNRVYAPALGRFMQRDPNATAQALLASSSTGRGFAAVSLAFSMEDLYGDGMNLYEYLGSNPWQRSDPLGLSWDPFSIVDDYLAETAGNRAALLSSLGQNTKAAALVAATIASYLPFPFVGNLGELALYALGESSDSQLAMGLALGVVPGGKLAHMFAKSGLGSFIGKIGASAWKSAKHYAGKAGSALGRGAGGLVDRARQFMGRKPGSACGCFTAGTVVWTLSGHVPIEQVEVGEIVITFDEETKLPIVGTVTDLIVTEGAALLELTVRHASGRLETIETTDEHPFWREADGDVLEGWARADALSPGGRVRTLSGSAIVESVRFGSERTTVYNLSVSTDPSYLIGDDGVWVHNCSKFTQPRNFRLAGQRHPETNVPFDSMGYPDFSDWSIATVRLPGGHQGRRLDRAEANRLAGFSETPAGYTWHHHQDNTTMQLVKEAIHTATGHTGSRPGP